jgi:exodeoxyribonuclease VII large subunit
MPDLIPSPAEQTIFSLLAVTARIQKILQPAIGKQFWVKAEISSCRERGGHFYCNLIETWDNGKIIAQLNCRIWRQSFDKIKAKFKQHNLSIRIEKFVKQ